MSPADFKAVAPAMMRRAQARALGPVIGLVYFRNCWIPIEAGHLHPGFMTLCRSDNDNWPTWGGE